MAKQRYGIATNGPHKGQLTPCNAQDPDKCKNHESGSHRNYTPEEAQAKQEELTREHVFKHVLGAPNGHEHIPASLHRNSTMKHFSSPEEAIGSLKKKKDSSNDKINESLSNGTSFEDSFYDRIDEFDTNHGNSDLYGINANDLDDFANKAFDGLPGSDKVTPEYRQRFVEAMKIEIRDKNDYDSDNEYGIDDGNVNRILMNVRDRMNGKNPPLRGVEDGQKDPFALSKDSVDSGLDFSTNDVLNFEDVIDTMEEFDESNGSSDYYEIPSYKNKEFADAILSKVDGGSRMSDEYKDKFRYAVALELKAQNEHTSGNSRWIDAHGIDEGWANLFTDNLVRRMRGLETRKRDED